MLNEKRHQVRDEQCGALNTEETGTLLGLTSLRSTGTGCLDTPAAEALGLPQSQTTKRYQ